MLKKMSIPTRIPLLGQYKPGYPRRSQSTITPCRAASCRGTHTSMKVCYVFRRAWTLICNINSTWQVYLVSVCSFTYMYRYMQGQGFWCQHKTPLINVQMSGWRKNKVKQRNLKESDICSIDTIKLCGNCWSLHLFGIGMRLEGKPQSLLISFVGANQFHLCIKINHAGNHTALRSLRL